VRRQAVEERAAEGRMDRQQQEVLGRSPGPLGPAGGGGMTGVGEAEICCGSMLP
jgi:hypothetical protein